MFKKFLNLFLIFSFLASLLFFTNPSFAQGSEENLQLTEEKTAQLPEEILQGQVATILEEREIIPTGSDKSQLYQKLEILITKGSLKGKKITVENGNIALNNLQKYQTGDQLMITYTKNFEGEDFYYISDYVRVNPLVWLFAIFVIMAVLVGRLKGFTSLIGMGISFLVIFWLIVPRISLGDDPVQIAILGSLIIIPATFLLSHGINKKTLIAIAGTLIALIITGFLATFFVEAAKLTGFASEEAGFIQALKPGVVNIKGLLLAGIIIGLLGILDDITISQSAIVEQLKLANPKLKELELYKKAMQVGKDHIASMINTLVLVYTGAALPLLILFIDNPRPFLEILNHEIITEEIVRTLVGSIGLILAVPITTFIAVFMFSLNKEKDLRNKKKLI